MVTTHSTRQRIDPVEKLLSLLPFMVISMGCARADTGEEANTFQEYRESQGTVGILKVEQSDTLLRITQFLRLEDGTISYGTMYRYPGFRMFFDPPNEKKVRSIQITTSRNSSIYLPMSKDIASYLFLVGKRLPSKAEGDGERKKDNVWSDWQLLEISAKDVSKDKPIVFPPFEELAKRELTQEQQELLKDLVERYEKIEAEAKKKMETPVPPR